MAKKVRPLNLALQGGGSHGAYTWGVIDRLLEDGRFEIDAISATSAGAMNAVVYAYGRMKGGTDGARELLEKFWQGVSESNQMFGPFLNSPMEDMAEHFGWVHPMAYQMFDTMTRIWSPYQFNPMNYNPLRDLLERTVNFEELLGRECTSLNITATNVRTGDVKVFPNEKVTADVIMASACLPMLFQAVEIEGEYYWDGGYMGNPAIFPLIYGTDTKDVLIVHLNPIRREEVPDDPMEIYNRINEISFNSSLLREMRAIAFVTKIIDEGWLKDEHKDKLKRMNIHSIRSDKQMCAYSVDSKFKTDWTFLTHLRDMGREATSHWLEKSSDMVGKDSSIDIRKEYLSQ
jgi:NTE family protein